MGPRSNIRVSVVVLEACVAFVPALHCPCNIDNPPSPCNWANNQPIKYKMGNAPKPPLNLNAPHSSPAVIFVPPVMKLFSLWLAVATAASGVVASYEDSLLPLALRGAPPPKPCRCYPGDSCWPSNNDWTSLNRTVGGRLVRAIPPGAVCYDTFEGIPTKNPTKCAEVASQWTNSSWAYVFPSISAWSI